VHLILHNWNHPLAEDDEYRSQLLETAVDVLNVAATGPRDQVFIEGLPATDMNLVAALWYAEHRAIQDAQATCQEGIEARQQWLNTVQRTLLSCFCSQEFLP